MALTKEQKTFIENVAKSVILYAPKHGIKVYSPIIAQAILESGWGKSGLAVKAHNYFGMKAGSTWTGATYTVETKEQKADGTYYTVKAKFRKYKSLDECIKGYFEFIEKDRYKNLKGVTDPKTYLTNIKNDGYATSLKYVDNLMKVINTYDLTKYDKTQPVKQETKVESKCFNKYTGKSTTLVKALNECKIASSYSYRLKIYKKNFKDAYKGTAKQNTNMLNLLKQGKLIKP